MKVIVAKSAGFCFGVEKAVDTVYNEIKEAKNDIYTFGPIIHNEEVVSDLEEKGVKVINSVDEIKKLSNCTVVIRSHGVAKEIYDALKEQGLDVVDATCPFVKKIHNIVREESDNGKVIIIVGNDHHPEVEGIKGWVNGKSFVINDESGIENLVIEPRTPVCIVSQTTFNPDKFNYLVEIIRQKGYDSNVVNTICNATHVRQEEAKEIASRVDAMIVIGGKNSSNTQKLFDICKAECDSTFYIQTAKDLDFDEIRKFNTIGITAGASTPNNIIEEVHTECQK